MNAAKINSERSTPLMAMVVAMLFMVSACGKKVTFPVSSVVPAAKGSVKINTDKNKNYEMEVTVTNLAEPSRLSPPKETYVVWLETEDNGIKNLGQLNSSSPLLSNTATGKLKSVTSFKPTRVFITAENSSAIEYPGAQVVLRTETFTVK